MVVLKNSDRQRLHWGCGTKGKPGWINADILPGPGVDVSGDILDGLPLATESMDYVVSIHALPEIAYSQIVPVLQELRRVLKTGGVLRLSLPDFEKALQAYTENDPHYFLIPDEEMKSRGGKLITQLLWRGAIRTIFITDFVEEMLFKAGFSQVHRCSFQTTQSQFGDEILELDDRPKESLFIEAVK